IKYAYMDGTVNQHNKVDQVVQEWSLYANITFHHSTELQGTTVRITFNPDQGSWSFVGTKNSSIPAGQATMNLGWIADTTNMADDERGVILHEFGHVLGLLHEHESPARSGTIHLDENNVYAYYEKTQGWNAATVKAQIIDVYNSTDVPNYSKLDLKSVMMCVVFFPGQTFSQSSPGTSCPGKWISNILLSPSMISSPSWTRRTWSSATRDRNRLPRRRSGLSTTLWRYLEWIP
ncbi:hypothetical protein C8J57DRAFT_1075447, partial [Mycena rebaudengoi]